MVSRARLQFFFRTRARMKLFTSIIVFAILCVGLGKAATNVVCGGSSSSKNLGLISPLMPPRVCEYTISAYSSNVCQLRIDFAMNLAQPSLPNGENGLSVPECIDDYLLIGDLKLCGVERSQHVYVPFNRTGGVKSVEISFVTGPRGGGSKLPPLSWDLQVIQLECPSGAAIRSVNDYDEVPQARSIKDGFLVAPPGCDQYFPFESGSIQSFNYNNGKGIYPYNLNYAICFRRTTDTIGLLIKGSDFNLGQESEDTSIFGQTDNHCYPQVHTEGRVEDYLMIPQATILENDVRASYFCGQSLDGYSILSTNPGPLLIVFNSDGYYQEGVTAQGFSLEYQILSD